MPFPRERWCHERCPCTFQLTLATIPSARFTECPKKERERERERLRRLATKITRKRESNKEGRGIITAISLNRHSSRLLFIIFWRGEPSFYLHTEFFQHSRFDLVWYYSLLAVSFRLCGIELYLCLHGRPFNSTHSVFRGIFLSWARGAPVKCDDKRQQMSSDPTEGLLNAKQLSLYYLKGVSALEEDEVHLRHLSHLSGPYGTSIHFSFLMGTRWDFECEF